ncbi:nucleolar protein dao-5-like isoform X2 [Palaemon carinicauda]|uniref:nucleolar protein dao-5-like isoform X2 n=1 Tax=Palaemon carinicauda TaxID=392227 RepID=UPI0035B65FE8
MTTPEVKQPAADDEASGSPPKQESNKRLSEDVESNSVEEELEKLHEESENYKGLSTPPSPKEQNMDVDGNEKSPGSIKEKNSPPESPPKKRQKTYIESVEDKENHQNLSEEQPEKDVDDPDDDDDDDDDIKVIEPSPKNVSEKEVSGREGAEKDGESPSKKRLSSVKVTRTYPGPTRKVNMFSKPDGRRYMILDRATIKGMMEKGLIQPIEKDGTNQTAAYRAVVPKTRPPGLDSSPLIVSGSQDSGAVMSTATSASGRFPSNVETSSTALISSAPLTSSSSNVRFPVPSIVVKHSPSGVSQVLSNPVFVKTSGSGSVPVSENMQYVTISSGFSNQIQNGDAPRSVTVASGSFATVVVQSGKNIPKGAVKIIAPSDKSVSPGDNADVTDSDDEDKKKKFGIPTGVCKVLKSMKMYQYVDKSEPEDGSTRQVGPPKNSHNVRWVAVPNNPGDPTPDCGPKIQRCTPPILPISVPDVADTIENGVFEAISNPSPEEQQASEEEFQNHYKVRELRQKQKEQLMYHRSRYSDLLMTYNELASKYDEIKDVGTIRQILSDAKKYMKKDHILFFRNEMLLKDRSGTGHRYSPKFMMMLMRYYNKSPIGYRFLRQIFTLPAVRTLLNWQNKSLHMRKKKKLLASQNLELGNEENENGSLGDGESHPAVTPRVPGGINYSESDSEDDDELDKMLMEKNNFSKANGENEGNYDGMASSNAELVLDDPE